MTKLILVAKLTVIVTSILLTVYSNKAKLKGKGIKYRIIEIIGIYIPILFILGYYAYMRTDTFEETKIVISGIYVCLILCILYFEIWIKSKYSYIILPIMIFTILIIVNFINSYMITGINKSYVFGIAISTWLATISSNKDKRRLFITGIISLVILISINYSTNSKVERVAIEHGKKLGYDITGKDKINILRGSTREDEIWVSIVGKKSDKDLSPTWKLRMVYFKGEIIECLANENLEVNN